MKVTFEINIRSEKLQSLDYYENFGKLGSEDAGCKKCIFKPMCDYFVDHIASDFEYEDVDCKFPCWKNQALRLRGQDRAVFVLKK